MKKIWLYMLTAFTAFILSSTAYAEATEEGQKITIAKGTTSPVANADFEFQPSPSVSMDVDTVRHAFVLTSMSISATPPNGMVYGIYSNTQGYYQRPKKDDDAKAPAVTALDADDLADEFAADSEWTYMGGTAAKKDS